MEGRDGQVRAVCPLMSSGRSHEEECVARRCMWWIERTMGGKKLSGCAVAFATVPGLVTDTTTVIRKP